VIAAALGTGRAPACAAGLAGGASATAIAEPPPAVAVPTLDSRFDPTAIYALPAPGVVAVSADLGAVGQAQRSGFAVDGRGTLLTDAHEVTNRAVAEGGAASAAATLSVEIRDRVPARVVGWDLASESTVSRVGPAAHVLAPLAILRGGNERRVGQVKLAERPA